MKTLTLAGVILIAIVECSFAQLALPPNGEGQRQDCLSWGTNYNKMAQCQQDYDWMRDLNQDVQRQNDNFKQRGLYPQHECYTVMGRQLDYSGRTYPQIECR